MRQRDSGLWVPERGGLVVAPDLRGYRTAVGCACGLGFGMGGGSKANKLLAQISSIMQVEEAAGGSAALYLGGYWVIDTGYAGGYRRITTWNDAFRAGAAYGWATHTAHTRTSTFDTSPSVSTMPDGSVSIDESTCGASGTVSGTIAGNVSRTLCVIADMNSATPGLKNFFCDGAGSALFGTNVSAGHQFFYDAIGGAVVTLGTHAVSYILNASTSKGKIITDGVSSAEQNYTPPATAQLYFPYAATYAMPADVAFAVYCTGVHPELDPYTNTVKANLTNLTGAAAVAALTAIRTICKAEEDAGGACFMFLAGDWVEQNPVQTWADVLAPGTHPYASYPAGASHTAHDATMTTDANEPYTGTLPNGYPALLGLGDSKALNIGGAFSDDARWSLLWAGNRTQWPVTYAVLWSKTRELDLGTVSTHQFGFYPTYGGQTYPQTGMHAAAVLEGHDTNKYATCLNGVWGADTATTCAKFGGVFGYAAPYPTYLQLGIMAFCTGDNALELEPLVRQYAQLTMGAP